MQKNEQDFSCNSLKNYYGKLSKGEKSKLLTYLSKEYGIPSATLQAKFSQRTPFRYMEVKMFSMEIEAEGWRKV